MRRVVITVFCLLAVSIGICQASSSSYLTNRLIGAWQGKYETLLFLRDDTFHFANFGSPDNQLTRSDPVGELAKHRVVNGNA